MSNPIADTAEYFSRRKQFSQVVEDDGQQETATDPEVITETNPLSDPKSQWLRVLNRISFLNATNEIHEEFSDDDSVIDRDTFELMRSAGKQQKPMPSRHTSMIAAVTSRQHSLNVSTSAAGAIRGRGDDTEEIENQTEVREEEEKLPSAFELENDRIYPLSQHQDEESSYFTHPFIADRLTVTPSRTTNEGNQTPQTPEDAQHRGKDKWDRTMDRLKLIANLQSSSNNAPAFSPNAIITGPSHTLATYYPPAFDPIFAAFAKDEYGRNLVSEGA